jgi:hypothetical protein
MKLKYEWKNRMFWEGRRGLTHKIRTGIVLLVYQDTGLPARLMIDSFQTQRPNEVEYLIEALIDANTIMQEWNKEI